jgi:hypothetical protein
VYSLARTLSVASGWVVPSGMTRAAVVPGGKRTVARRVPSASVVGAPRETCIAGSLRAMEVTCASTGIMTTSGTNA